MSISPAWCHRAQLSIRAGTTPRSTAPRFPPPQRCVCYQSCLINAIPGPIAFPSRLPYASKLHTFHLFFNLIPRILISQHDRKCLPIAHPTAGVPLLPAGPCWPASPDRAAQVNSAKRASGSSSVGRSRQRDRRLPRPCRTGPHRSERDVVCIRPSYPVIPRLPVTRRGMVLTCERPSARGPGYRLAWLSQYRSSTAISARTVAWSGSASSPGESLGRWSGFIDLGLSQVRRPWARTAQPGLIRFQLHRVRAATDSDTM